ncbi:CBS domain-containing protein [Tepidibacter formicigenes]|jgi:CBS domain-containing protein|uniref:CBS domain-containing protein n=1 Tax=Tepidibacter formicigenes DSM 15518 TaxID=1123349 RepID=A0A1M6N4Y8_9FIRM|nr:CBS domain-containing protein [Tepidibacter formicigenes]SHJ90757.1 CBS domain-containing protein [Tepidibacter formicigenes DSM 15518]
MKVRDVMTKDVSYVTVNSNIAKAADIMRDLDVGIVPVCDENKTPVGVVTDRDIVLRSVTDTVNSNQHVGSIMSRNVVSVTPDTDAHEAASLMASNQIRRLPVVENNKLVGMLSLGDLAVVNIHVNEAGEALSHISEPASPDKRMY